MIDRCTEGKTVIAAGRARNFGGWIARALAGRDAKAVAFTPVYASYVGARAAAWCRRHP